MPRQPRLRRLLATAVLLLVPGVAAVAGGPSCRACRYAFGPADGVTLAQGPATPLGGDQGNAPGTPAAGASGSFGGAAEAPGPDAGASSEGPAVPDRGPTIPLGGNQGATPGPPAGAASGPGSGQASSPSDSRTAPADCARSGDSPLTAVGQVLGIWTNERGETISIAQIPGGRPSDVIGTGAHIWTGSFEAGKLRLKRYPKPSELGDAPDWARQAAVDKHLEWELELEARTECGQPVLTGKWYPGAFKWSEKFDANGAADPSSRQVADIGRGIPIDVRYVQPPPVIVGVAVLEQQTRQEKLGEPFYVYPFQPGADDTGAALTSRHLYVYGVNLPRTRDGKITVTSDDPNIEYLVLAVQRDREILPALEERFRLGLRVAQAGRSPAAASQIAGMDAVLLRASLRRGSGTSLLPGIKSFRLNGAAGSWQLRFGDDTAFVTFARAGDGSLAAPAELAEDQVEPTSVLFKPERIFIQVKTDAPLPLDSIPLRVGVDDRKVTWNGSPTITATRVAGSATIYRTPAIEIVPPGTAPSGRPGAYLLPTDGNRIFASIDDPWLFRHNPGAARLLSGPGDLGHTYRYYLRRAALADGLTLPDLSTPDGWRQLSGQTAATLTDVAVLTGYLGPSRKPRTWKQELVDEYLKQRHPLVYYLYHADSVLQTIRVSVAEHAALLFFRDTFVAQMGSPIDGLQSLLDEYRKNRDSAAMRGLRDYLKAFAWNDASLWTHIGIACPGAGASQAAPTGSDCPLSYALSDSFLEKAFPDDRAAADRWSIGATAEAAAALLDAARDARDKAKALADTDIRGMVKTLGRGYEPLLPQLIARLMRQDETGKWVPDLAARYSLRELHQLTDAVVAQEELAHADAAAAVKLALMPLVMMAAPALIAEEAVAAAAVSWGLYGANAVVDVSEAYFQLPDVRFALGASLALGAEQLSAAETRRRNIFFNTVDMLARGALMNAAGEAVLPLVLAVGKSAAEMARPAIAAIRRQGAAAFQKLNLTDQAAVLGAMLRAKAVQQEGALAFAGAFEREAVEAADRLAADAGIPPAKPVAEPPIAARGDPLAKAETLALELRPAAEIEGEVIHLDPEDLIGPSAGDAAAPKAAPAKEPTQLYGQEDYAALLMAREQELKWQGAPEGNSEIRLAPSARATPEAYELGNRLGAGAYVWTLELTARNGEQIAKPTVLKLAGRSIDDFFSGREMVANSAYGYRLFTERTNIRVLQTTFYPDGVEILPSGPKPMPFMIQESLGPTRRLLSDVVKQFGESGLPEGVQKKLVELWAELKRARIYPEDMNWNNLYVELRDGSAGWKDFLETGRGSVEVGVLDFDRVVLWDEYVGHNAGKMGEFLSWVELRVAPKRLRSMGAVYGSPGNRKLMTMIGTMNERGLTAYLKARPGPYWTDELDYALEKMLEYHKYVKFDPAAGKLVKGIIEPRFLEDAFPLLNDSSRFEPFPLGEARANPPSASQPWIRRSRRRRPCCPGRRSPRRPAVAARRDRAALGKRNGRSSPPLHRSAA